MKVIIEVEDKMLKTAASLLEFCGAEITDEDMETVIKACEGIAIDVDLNNLQDKAAKGQLELSMVYLAIMQKAKEINESLERCSSPSIGSTSSTHRQDDHPERLRKICVDFGGEVLQN